MAVENLDYEAIVDDIALARAESIELLDLMNFFRDHQKEILLNVPRVVLMHCAKTELHNFNEEDYEL